MLIKTDSLGILFIYRNFTDRKRFNTMLNESFSDAFSSLFGRNKEHFQFSIFYPHKANGQSSLTYGNYQMRNLL